MSKQIKPTVPTTTVKHSELGVALEKWGSVGYLSDIIKPTVAIESLITTPTSNSVVTMSGGSPPETTVIFKKEGDYHVYFHINELSSAWWGTNLDSFTNWVMTLTSDDTVYFYQTGTVNLLPHTVQALVLLDTLCLAKTVFVVDHIIETPLFLLVCKDLQIEDTGAIAFSSCISDDARKCEQVFRPYLKRLYDRAVNRSLLSVNEAKSVIEDNCIVFKTARELRSL